MKYSVQIGNYSNRKAITGEHQTISVIFRLPATNYSSKSNKAKKKKLLDEKTKTKKQKQKTKQKQQQQLISYTSTITQII